ncbi:Ig-like domain-containing protein [Congregibacter sp.]|uniref:Ig-like domain-containing protein n=1 Tax=Congregibacter sp. TaxID=2744308 RepID=UPI003F6D6A21
MLLRNLILIAAIGAASTTTAGPQQVSKAGYLQLNKSKEILELDSAGERISTQAVPDGCVTGDFDQLLQPSDALTGTLLIFGESASVRIWREACEADTAASAVVLRITPDSERTFICSSAFNATQSGVQYSAIKLIDTVGGEPFCDDLFSEDTYLLDQFKLEGEVFDENLAFNLNYNGQFVAQVPAYEEAGTPGLGDQFELLLEEPVDGGTASGVSNVRGWAVASEGIESIELFLDGTSIGLLPYGGIREDVEDAFPDVSNSLESGFSASFNYGSLGAGQHTIIARAKTLDGQEKESSSTFTVATFPDDFIDERDFPSFTEATTQIQDDEGTILVSPVTLPGGATYSVELRWITATQGFEIISVTPLN